MSALTVRQQCRSLLLAGLESIVDLLLDAAAEAQTDLLVVEDAVGRAILQMRPVLLEHSIELARLVSDRHYLCPDCREPLSPWGERKRRIVTSQGETNFKSVRYRCRKCGRDAYPLEEANGLDEGVFTTAAKAKVASEAADEAFIPASGELARIGLNVSAKQVDRLVAQVSGWHEADELSVLYEAFPNLRPKDHPAAAAPRLHEYADWPADSVGVVSVDGAKVRSPEVGPTGLEWFEVRCGMIGRHVNGDTTPECRMAGHLDADSMFVRLAAYHRTIRSMARVWAFVADGAPWIWERVPWLFPDAIAILDIYHAGEHVGVAAAAAFGPDQPTTKLWKAKARSMLLAQGGVRSIIKTLVACLREGRCVDRAGVERELRYLWTNRHRMRYAEYEAAGLPVGSGAMESTIKQVCTQRLRRAGMMWTREGADRMLRLRAAHLNGDLKATTMREHRRLQFKLESYRPIAA